MCRARPGQLLSIRLKIVKIRPTGGRLLKSAPGPRTGLPGPILGAGRSIHHHRTTAANFAATVLFFGGGGPPGTALGMPFPANPRAQPDGYGQGPYSTGGLPKQTTAFGSHPETRRFPARTTNWRPVPHGELAGPSTLTGASCHTIPIRSRPTCSGEGSPEVMTRSKAVPKVRKCDATANKRVHS